jgi:hypothetical protein
MNKNKDHIIRYLASITCLVVAVYSFWTMHDLLVFIILIGVATGQIGIREAIGSPGQHTRLGSTGQESSHKE